jgi:hypothetical protein
VVEISKRLGTWDVLEPFVVATKIINVPVAKHHELTGVTGGFKNWIGSTNISMGREGGRGSSVSRGSTTARRITLPYLTKAATILPCCSSRVMRSAPSLGKP